MLSEKEMSHNVFTLMKFQMDCHVNPHQMRYSRYENWDTDEVCHTLVGRFLTNRLGVDTLNFKTPASWWQMLKRDVLYPHPLTRWYVDMFPVVVKDNIIEYEKFAVCPHVETNKGRYKHFEFLENGEDF